MGNPMLHAVEGEPGVVTNGAISTQVASNTHILCPLRDVLPEDVFVGRGLRSALHSDRSVRFDPDCLALIFELRVKELEIRVCVVSLSLKASIRQEREHLELLTNYELPVVKVKSEVFVCFRGWAPKEVPLTWSVVVLGFTIHVAALFL